MPRSPSSAVLFVVALWAALFFVPASAADGGVSRPFPDDILQDDNPYSADVFLKDAAAQALLKSRDPALYQRVFTRAAELKDLEGVLRGAASAHSIRQSLLERPACAFCQDPVAFPGWARRYLTYLDPQKIVAIDAALWSWDSLEDVQKKWLVDRNSAQNWPALDFFQRHELMRLWAKEECDALLKLNPSDPPALAAYESRVYLAGRVLSSDEMTEVWHRMDDATQAVASMAQARAKVGAGADPRLKALLADAQNAADPASRMAALSKLFENMGEHPRDLLQAAPPRADQRFDPASRRLVGDMLKTALLKETENTFAGQDLKDFYAPGRTPLTLEFSTTSDSALGWYQPGEDALHINERYIEQYLKSRGASVQDLERDPALLRDVARTVVGTFVHEAQHHRQDVWAREQKLPRQYSQSDEVEAFQVQALFLLQKMKRDPSFKAFADSEAAHSNVLQTGLGRARHMEEDGPEYFEWTVPNAHYPEVLSLEGDAWCNILWHNRVTGEIEAELSRRAGLPAAQQTALEGAAPLEKSYKTHRDFTAALPAAGTASVRESLDRSRQAAAQGPDVYAKFRGRREAVAKLTMERYKMVESGQDGARDAVPPPARGAR